MRNSSAQPLVSICIPAYNNAEFIQETIKCIINQTYSNWELIIADDCSKDNTVDVVKSFTDHRIRLVEHKNNLGLAGNWNSLVPELKGEFVKLVCGDDLIKEDCIEKQLEIFLSKKYPTVSLVSCYTDLIDESSKRLFTKKFPFNNGLISAKKAIIYNYYFGKNVIGEPSSGMFKREAFAKIGLYDTENLYMIDLDFWFRVLLLGDMYVIPEPLACFRLNKQATTTKIKNTQADLFIKFMRKIKNDARYSIKQHHLLITIVNAKIMQFLRGLVLRFFLK